jgi:hypothetical protein
MFHVFHNVPRKMGLVEHGKSAWLLGMWRMFQMFQYFLVNKISITTNNGRRSVSRKFCFWRNIGTFWCWHTLNMHGCNLNRVPHKCSIRYLDRGTCGTYFSPWCTHHPHYFVMIVVGHTLNMAFKKKPTPCVDICLRRGCGGRPPRDVYDYRSLYCLRR